MIEKKKKFQLNKNVLFVLSIPLLVALGVFIGSYFVGNASQGKQMVEARENVKEQTVNLEEFVLNLEPTGNARRYIRLELALSTIEKGGIEKIENKMSVIRDAVIYEVSKRSIDKVYEDADNSFLLKEQLKNKINEMLDEELINEVYISNMVIQ